MTDVGEAVWVRPSPGFRRFERTVVIGHGDDCWNRATHDVLRWVVKTRSGFSVEPAESHLVREGAELTLIARVGPLRIREPIRVVAVVQEAARYGFAYGTRPGHPVSGEEAFIVHRTPEGTVSLTLRSLTRPGRGRWRLLYPAVLVAQRIYRRRYLRSLLQP